MAGLKSRKAELVLALLEKGADPNARLEKQPPRVGYTVFTGLTAFSPNDTVFPRCASSPANA